MPHVLDLAVVGHQPIGVLVGRLVLPFGLRRPDLAQPQLDAQILEELDDRGVDRLPACAGAHHRGHVVGEHLLGQAPDVLEAVDEAPLEIGFLLELGILEVMEPGIPEGRAEQVEQEGSAVHRRELDVLHPVDLELLPRIGLVERVGRAGFCPLCQPVLPDVCLEVVVSAAQPLLVFEVPVGGFHPRPRMGENLDYLVGVPVELGRLFPPFLPLLALIHPLYRVPVFLESPRELAEIRFHAHNSQYGQSTD